ncbi:hypothetical protein Tco_0521938 [Tanacetum coccineum]
MRYVDTKSNKKELKKCIFDGPYVMTRVLVPAKPTTKPDPPIPEHNVLETYENTLAENHAYIDVEAEAIHLILTGIRDDIYSTVDACTTTKEMWITIERLQQGKSLNKQDVKTNLFWEFGKFTSRDGESIESYYSRFYKMMNEMVRNKLEVATMKVNVQFLQQLQPEWSIFVTVVKQTVDLDKESYHKLFDILKQYHNEVNEIHVEKLAMNANPLALTSSSSRSHAPTRTKGKEIAKPVTPLSESTFDEDIDPEQAQRDKDMQKNLALIEKYFKNIYKPTNNNLRTSSNTKNKTIDNSLRYRNDKQSWQFGNQRTVIVAGARETVVEKGVPLRAEQGDWLDDTDEEPAEPELEAHYMYMAKI